MDRFERAIQNLRARRQRILDGLINCIPLPFNRLSKWWPGIERKKYIICTANQKVGKSKLCDFLYVYQALFYAMEHPNQLKLNILYFTLEMGQEEKYYEFISYLLNKLDNIRISPSNLKSVDAKQPVSEEILDLLETEKYKKYVDYYKQHVEYVDDIKNPTGIYKKVKDFMSSKGKFHYKKVKIKDEFGIINEVDKKDYFEYNDSEEYNIVIIDNYSNLSLEQGMNKMANIDKWSKYAIELRDSYELIIVGIQHQAQSQEGIENQKLNKLYPSADGLADCKTTSRDLNMLIGLFSPFKYGISEYGGFDITKFKNNIRFLLIIEDRDYGSGGQICPLLFDGEVSSFSELPLPEDKNSIEKVYKYINTVIRKTTASVFLLKNNKKNIKNNRQKLFNKWNVIVKKIKQEIL